MTVVVLLHLCCQCLKVTVSHHTTAAIVACHMIDCLRVLTSMFLDPRRRCRFAVSRVMIHQKGELWEVEVASL
jgi:hypothetical protein